MSGKYSTCTGVEGRRHAHAAPVRQSHLEPTIGDGDRRPHLDELCERRRSMPAHRRPSEFATPSVQRRRARADAPREIRGALTARLPFRQQLRPRFPLPSHAPTTTPGTLRCQLRDSPNGYGTARPYSSSAATTPPRSTPPSSRCWRAVDSTTWSPGPTSDTSFASCPAGPLAESSISRASLGTRPSRTRTLSSGSTPTSSGAPPSACSATIPHQVAPVSGAVSDGVRRTDTQCWFARFRRSSRSR